MLVRVTDFRILHEVSERVRAGPLPAFGFRRSATLRKNKTRTRVARVSNQDFKAKN